MNSFPNDPEARLTALLLGELSAEEAAEVRQAIDQDPRLADLHHRLRKTVALVRAALAVRAVDAPAPERAPRLSEQRRQELLQCFRVVPLKPKAPKTRRRWMRISLQFAAVLAVLAIAAGLIVPLLFRPVYKMSSIINRSEAQRVQQREWFTAESEIRDRLGSTVRLGEELAAIEAPAGGTVASGGMGGGIGGGGGFGGGGGPVDELSRGFRVAPSPTQEPTVRRRLSNIVLPAVEDVDSLAESRVPGQVGFEVNGRMDAYGAYQAEGAKLEPTTWAMSTPEPTLGRHFSGELADSTAQVRSAPLADSLFAAEKAPQTYWDDQVPRLGDLPVLGQAFRPADAGRTETRYAGVAVQPAPDAAPTARGGVADFAMKKTSDPQAIAAAVSSGLAAMEPEALEPLAIELPVPAFMGTPVDIFFADSDKDSKGRSLARVQERQLGLQEIAAANGPDPASGVTRGAGNYLYRNAGLAGEPLPAPPAVIPSSVSGRAEATNWTESESLAFGLQSSDGWSRAGIAAATADAEGRGIALPSLAPTAGNEAAVDQLAAGKPMADGDALGVERYDVKLARKAAPERGQLATAGRQLTEELVREEAPATVAAPPVALEAKLSEFAEAESQSVAVSDGNAIGFIETEAAAAPAPRRAPAPEPQPEIATAEQPFSTFSLNVADVSFKLAAASLDQGQMPDAATVRSEEFINAFAYHDPEPGPGRRVGVNWERARYPFAHNRDVLRFSVQTAARGREAGRPLNLVLCLDNSGSMERADRVQILHEALAVLAAQLQARDQISVVAFARTPRLWVDALPGDQAGELVGRVGELNPEGGTNLEAALRLAYEIAAARFIPTGINRVVVLTDGAANLGDVDPESLRQTVIAQRQGGIALDCFGIGWEGYNDDLLETLSRNGDGRYGFLNTPEEATQGFAAQLAGALQVAASDVKVQVEFNPQRVRQYRQIGYAKHQLTKEQFRDNTVDAAEIGAAEAGNALYIVEVAPEGSGPVAIVRVRFRVPETGQYEESEWVIPYDGPAPALESAAPSLRLAVVASAFSEWLAGSPFAGEVTPTALGRLLRDVPEVYGLDPRPRQLESMIRQAGSLIGQ